MSRPICRDPDSPYVVRDLRGAGGSVEHATAYGPASLDRAAELEQTERRAAELRARLERTGS